MTAEFVQHFALASRAESPYFQLAFRNPEERHLARFPVQRVRVSLSDTAIGWHISECSTACLPPFPWPDFVLRAHGFLHHHRPDPAVAAAHYLNLPESRLERDLLRAVLICTDLPLPEQAERCGLDLEVLRGFEELFFNVKDRCGERLYLAELCRIGPFSRGRMAGSDEDHLARQMLRIAFRTNSTDLVLGHEPGAVPSRLRPREVSNQIIAHAAARLRAGAISKEENPLLEPVLRLMSKERQERGALCREKTGPSPAEAIHLMIEDIAGSAPQSASRCGSPGPREEGEQA